MKYALVLGGVIAAGPVSATSRPQETKASATRPPAPDAANADDATQQEGKSKRKKTNASPDPARANHSLGGAFRDFVSDQKDIWTSPARLRLSDADWLVPSGGFAAALFVTD